MGRFATLVKTLAKPGETTQKPGRCRAPFFPTRLARMLSLIALAAGAFAATNIDNLFVLLAFVAEARGRLRPVVAGQFAGSLALIAVATGLAGLVHSLPHGYVGLLGVLPVAVGLVKARARFLRRATPAARDASRRPPDDAALPARSARTASPPPAPLAIAPTSWWTVAGVAISNGSDNIAVYVPLYAVHTGTQGVLISLVFVVLTGVWCAGAAWLVHHPLLGAPIRRYGTALLPFILLVIGTSVIVGNDTLRVLFGI